MSYLFSPYKLFGFDSIWEPIQKLFGVILILFLAVIITDVNRYIKENRPFVLVTNVSLAQSLQQDGYSANSIKDKLRHSAEEFLYNINTSSYNNNYFSDPAFQVAENEDMNIEIQGTSFSYNRLIKFIALKSGRVKSSRIDIQIIETEDRYQALLRFTGIDSTNYPISELIAFKNEFLLKEYAFDDLLFRIGLKVFEYQKPELVLNYYQKYNLAQFSKMIWELRKKEFNIYDSALLRSLIYSCINDGRFGDAEHFVNTALRFNPVDLPNLTAKYICLLNRKNKDSVRVIEKTFEKVQPNYFYYLLNRADAKPGDTDTFRLKLYKRAISAAEPYSIDYKLRAITLLKASFFATYSNSYSDADSLMLLFLKFHPVSAEIIVNQEIRGVFDKVSPKLSKITRNSTSMYFLRYLEATIIGSRSRAYANLEKINKEYPHISNVEYLMARELELMGKVEEAEELYSHVNFESGNYVNMVSYSSFLMRQGNGFSASDLSADAFRLAPRFAVSCYIKNKFQIGDSSLALKLCYDEILHDPYNFTANFIIGHVLASRNNSKAIRYLESAQEGFIDLYDDLPRVYLTLGGMYQVRGANENAYINYEKYFELSQNIPDTTVLHVTRELFTLSYKSHDEIRMKKWLKEYFRIQKLIDESPFKGY